MLTQAEIENAQIRAASLLSEAGIVLTRGEQSFRCRSGRVYLYTDGEPTPALTLVAD